MNGFVVVATVVAGGIGATLRYVVDGWLTRLNRLPFPLGTLVINVSGSFALGVVTRAVAETAFPSTLGTVIGAGLLAGYTTFSTASTQTVDLLQKRHQARAIGFSAGMFVGSLCAAAVGFWCASLLR